MNNRIVNVGLIGTGMIGSLHAGILTSRTNGARVAAVMDIDGERAAAAAADCGGARVYSDAEALIKAADVDAVLIASPDIFHAEQALACIAAGKPVLCEKPMATTRADAERILRAEMAAGRRLLQVGFMREYDRAHKDLLALSRSGAIGGALRFRGIHMNPSRSSHTSIDTAIVNSLIHDIHSARFMMDAEIAEVFLRWVPSDPGNKRSARYAIIHVSFDGGAIGTLEWSGDSGYGYEVEVEITGERGTAGTTGVHSPILRQAGLRSQAISPDWPQRFYDAYVDELAAWIGSVVTGQATGPSAWDGYMSLAVAEACVKSAESGQPERVMGRERPAMY
ncbi:MAG: Gfo/Idh/MocA family oxidoreductase [Chloroflexota bacterium]|nr:Gfo/Idh/MocA family oxidoreductase [Chloroflexota bacterium]